MPDGLKAKNLSIVYNIKVSRRAKRMRISVGCDTGVVVTLPWGFKQAHAEKFVRQKQEWILKSLRYFKKFQGRIFIKSGRREYLKNRQQALDLVRKKIEKWNALYGFSFNRVTVKNQTTRWGSCSKKGNLNFNHKIIHLPDNLVDYLVVHELCHLKEMNHSKNFWELVGREIFDYKKLRRELRKSVF